MLDADELRNKARAYRADARKAKDAYTRDLYLAVAKYLEAWAAAQTQAKGAPPADPLDRKAG